MLWQECENANDPRAGQAWDLPNSMVHRRVSNNGRASLLRSSVAGSEEVVAGERCFIDLRS